MLEMMESLIFGFLSLLYYLIYFSIFLSFLFFCLSFLSTDPLMSCVMMCVGIFFLSCYVSLGLHVWYCYFVVLIFLSGIFSLLTYFCSMCNYGYCLDYRVVFFFLFFCVLFLFFVDLDFSFFFYNGNFLYIYYDFSYYYVFWIVMVLFLLLLLLSFNFGDGCYMRGL
uniref:NADH dehydrogenase subunit 6 n=1 Tax=Litomosoides sigmodontis TaxID=42156 RepID=A0A347YCA6_LITSI|nr:NADH dehydrogenase subunit 6 [Litomosoides sigmodontis]